MKKNQLLFALSKCGLTILMAIICIASNAQINQTDTLRISFKDAEQMFLERNYELLAAHYNVDASKALIEQARLWDNPALNTDQVISADHHFLPYGKNVNGTNEGQYYIQIEQLIRTAGKRGKAISLATTNSKLNELQLQDVLRNLHYQLATDYYTLISQLKTWRIYESQLTEVERLLKGMQMQLSSGNIAQKDYLRVQALDVSLQQDITDLKKAINDTQADLRTLLAINTDVFIRPSLEISTDSSNAFVQNVDELIQTALHNNPYYLLQQTQTQYQQQNFSYQKALRVPDVSVGPNFDKNSNFAPNYFGLSLSLPIPLFNKNQGNIKAAEYSIKQQQASTQNAETELRNNIITCYKKYVLTMQQNNATQIDFYKSYQNMFEKMLQSYLQRQISLLEFLDFFNAYKESQLRLIQQQLNLQLAKEEVNYNAGTEVIK